MGAGASLAVANRIVGKARIVMPLSICNKFTTKRKSARFVASIEATSAFQRNHLARTGQVGGAFAPSGCCVVYNMKGSVFTEKSNGDGVER